MLLSELLTVRRHKVLVKVSTSNNSAPVFVELEMKVIDTSQYGTEPDNANFRAPG